MARRKKRDGSDSLDDMPIELFLLGGFSIVAIYIFLLFDAYSKDLARFWMLISYGVVALILFILAVLGFRFIRDRMRENKIANVLARVRDAQLEGEIQSFIDRFGFEKGKNVWRCRNRSFDRNRINDLREDIKQKGVNLREDELDLILEKYIDEAERRLTIESLHKKSQKFSSLSGSEFEQLLYRLFEKMGYAVQLTGKAGDQGGDLVANKDGERILIQAKRYGDAPVSNDAVQEAVAARNFYQCTKAMVVTTSHFTAGAIELARANNVELVLKEQLQPMLLQYLQESWD